VDVWLWPTNSPAYQAPKLIVTVPVGGVQAQYYEQQLCPPGITPQLKNYVWYVKSRGVLVVADDTTGGKIGLSGLRAALDNVEWK
jgi:hypothetical protein